MSDENNPGPLNAYDKFAWPTGSAPNDPEVPKPFKADYSLLAGQVAASIADGTFKREERYIVTKIKTSNNKVGSIPIKTHQRVDAVVVEKDWPEYEVVWGMLQDRVEGRPNCIERLEADLFTAAERERALQHENENLRAECMSMAMQATPRPSTRQDYKDMVDRFLGWKLPSDFAPDAGVSFDREYGEKWGMPVGTNLLHAGQAEAMFRYCVQPSVDEQLARALERERALEAKVEEPSGRLLSLEARSVRAALQPVETMDPTTRFDLEQAILGCWNITSDLDVLMEGVLEKDMTPDDISNVLIGLKTLYDMRFDSCFNKFEKLISKGDIK